MAFTVTLAPDGRPTPAIICDVCDGPVGTDGQVVWGPRCSDGDGGVTPISSTVTALGSDGIDGDGDTPYTCLTTCSENCLARLYALWDGIVPLERSVLGLADYLAWICLSSKFDPLGHAAASIDQADRREPVH